MRTRAAAKPKCNSKMPDMELIQAFLATQGDPCFSQIYNRYGTKVYSKCLAMLKDEAAAKDATQDIFMKLFVNLASFKDKAQFSTWLYSITYNYCIDVIRKKKRRGNIFSDEMEKAPDIEDDTINEKILLEMKVKNLRKVLEKIPDEDKYVLLLKYQEDKSIKEIAQIFGKTESAIKMKIKRAKEKAVRVSKQFKD